MDHTLKIGCAIIGSGNIGTDLMVKVLRHSRVLEMKVMVGIDPDSDGLARARRFGVATTAEGVAGLLRMPEWTDVRVIFDATSAKAHHANYELIRAFPDKWVIDLTPAAIGPYVIPPVNLEAQREARNVNMVTCGGQATIPMVYAVHRVAPVLYGEIIASIASRSAGPGTRANIDEFTETTARAIEQVGGARLGKAIIVLNPAEPPLIMRDTIFTLSPSYALRASAGSPAIASQGNQPSYALRASAGSPAIASQAKEQIRQSVADMVRAVQQYVPGYRLKQEVQFEDIPIDKPVFIDGLGLVHGLKTSIFLEVEGAGHYLPAYAGNLDIMTSAALATAERLVMECLSETPPASPKKGGD